MAGPHIVGTPGRTLSWLGLHITTEMLHIPARRLYALVGSVMQLSGYANCLLPNELRPKNTEVRGS